MVFCCLISKRIRYYLFILTILSIFLSIINCSKKVVSTGSHEREIIATFDDTCDEFKYILKLALNIHLTKKESDFLPIYQNTLQKYLEYKKIEPSKEGQEKNSLDTFLCKDVSYIEKNTKDNRVKIMQEVLFLFMQQLDPHSFFLFDKNMMVKENWKYGNELGVGVYLDLPLVYVYGKPFKEFRVNQVAEKSEASGKILEGDKIIGVNGKSVSNLKYSEFLGEFSQTPVKIQVKRGEEVLQPISLPVRKNGSFLSINYENFGDFDYIRLRHFHKGASEFLNSYLTLASTHKGLILDLRSNPGGSFDEALKIADLIVSSSLVVTTEARSDANEFMLSNFIKPKNEYFAIDFTSKLDIPLIVLLNHKSASAAELLSGYLQKIGAAIIIGERSFGKGVAQHIFSISKQNVNGELRVTTERFLLPDGTNVQKIGVIPDIQTDDMELNSWMVYAREENKKNGVETIFREEDFGQRTIERRDNPVTFKPKFFIDEIKTKLKNFVPTNTNGSDDPPLEIAKQYMVEYIKLKLEVN